MNELNSDAKSLVLALRRARVAPPAAKERMRRAVLVGVATSGAAAAATLSAGKLVIVGVLWAAVGSGVTVAVIRGTAAQPRPSTPSVMISAPVPVARSLPTPSVPPAEPVAVSPTPLPVPVERPRPSTPESELEAELSAIDAILCAVEATNPAEGRAAFVSYRARWPHGQLGLEATALEVLILCAEQRTGEARTVARELERRAPFNPSVRRLRSSCAATTEP